MKKRGNILTENVIFLILNLAFLAILVVFILKQGAGAVVLEQSYAKQIALLIDGARPGMVIELDMEEGRDVDEEWFETNFDSVIDITGNKVTIK